MLEKLSSNSLKVQNLHVLILSEVDSGLTDWLCVDFMLYV